MNSKACVRSEVSQHSLPGVRRVLTRLIRRLSRWHQLARERRQLASLSDAGLKDLGLSRGDVFQETERPFWDDPLCK
ncbi:Uncharacterized conserved protein YjiS, DUF1127 family [Pseudomonas flavescens]|uniref:Uncharacterized conserved protein YjiS, DUF1127 family n=1 Tax=Phytopseudomonas flavescens TaxID=29435 RepID=A0A1G8L361_9GAMM|nr:DUF1127 domain-containing protein [Pseudomonas flavescens]SDI50007.1 Uncharacterized conserved protein YjiS, DUF1127 family [Pseudomonas flavescens]